MGVRMPTVAKRIFARRSARLTSAFMMAWGGKCRTKSAGERRPVDRACSHTSERKRWRGIPSFEPSLVVMGLPWGREVDDL